MSKFDIAMNIDEEYFKSEDFQELLKSYEASINAGTTPFMDADDLVDMADYYAWQGFNDKAEQAIDYALELYPSATLPNVFKARKALAIGDFTQAEYYCDEIESHDDPDYHYLVAEILIAKGDIQAADNYLREYGKSVEPDEYEDFVRDCANLYIDYDENQKAYEWMMRSRGDESDDFKELMARTLFGIGKYKDSERIFNELIDHHPYSKIYWTALASVQFMNEDYSNAITSSEYAIAIDPNDPDAVNSKASGLFRLGNYEEAMKYYKRYSELTPDDEYGLLHQGICLVNLNRNEEALPILRMALALAPKDSLYLVQIYQELAFCYSALHQVKQAVEMLEKTDALDCDHIDALVVNGHILLQNQLIVEAQEVFRQAIHQSHNDPNVILRIIVSLYDNRYLEACYQMLLKFFKMVKEYNPDYKSGNAYMALCCYDLHRSADFMKYLRLAVDNDPQEAKCVLSCLFPEGTPISEYVPYMEQRLQNISE
jgi:tetratricopeptide (TPR) repeat protein